MRLPRLGLPRLGSRGAARCGGGYVCVRRLDVMLDVRENEGGMRVVVAADLVTRVSLRAPAFIAGRLLLACNYALVSLWPAALEGHIAVFFGHIAVFFCVPY